ncbi:hypothetical protein T03_1970 [Trichinella britovi]|uniref:Uncharacterized protein n=1 Tax=Trichinella britovi TaxID=45882 RepID=A0A0V1CZM8_TRIBR|nr:hypothetical protein T03_1970 [Trichinella britovi]
MFEQGAFPPVAAQNARILVRIRVFHACCLCSPVQNSQTCRILRHQLIKGVSKQDGTVEVPEKTVYSGITSVNKNTSLSR